MRCVRCNEALPLGQQTATRLLCAGCATGLEARLALVRVGWISPPLTEDEIADCTNRAAAALMKEPSPDNAAWREAMTDYCRRVIYRERDLPPEEALAYALEGCRTSAHLGGLLAACLSTVIFMETRPTATTAQVKAMIRGVIEGCRAELDKQDAK